MPNRIIRETICKSDSIDQLTPFQEVVFYRLIVNCDDFGRFDARAKLVSSLLFPLKTIEEDDMEDALQALVKADLITIYTVNGKRYLQMNTWLKYQQKRSDKSKYPSPDEADCDHVIADDIKCNQMQSSDSKFPRNRDRDTYNENRESESFIGDADAHEIQTEQNRVLDAAEDAGFKMGNTVRAKLIALYAEYGLDKMLNSINECVRHSACSLAYLEAVLNGSPKKRKVQVSAQDFEQRDYSDVQRQLMEKQNQEVIEHICRSSGLWDEANNKPVDNWEEQYEKLKEAGD